jgi:hypothetical protein
MSRAHNVGITFKLHRRVEGPFPTLEAAVVAGSACCETAIVIVLVVNAYTREAGFLSPETAM